MNAGLMDENKSCILKSSELAVGYTKEIIVGGVNLSVCAGEVLCLIGPNGSGKSTILKTITRELQALGGKIFLLGKDASRLSQLESARHLSMVMTEKIRPEFMTCREVVESARYPYTGRLGLLSDQDKAAVTSAIEAVGARELSDKLFGKVSDGQKQRIMLARAIAQDTEIIVLDEPTSFLDMRYKIDLIRIIKSLAKNQNKAVIMSLHELDLVKAVADKVVCVGEGKILRTGKVEEIFCGNFIQKLYGIKDEEFESQTARLKINFDDADSGKVEEQALRAAIEPAERVARNEVLTRGKHSLPNRSIDEANRQSRRTGGFNASSIFGKGETSPHLIMVQGTMSSAGKSLLVAGLCRIFKQDGWKVAPFKSQNMALNSFVTDEGLEMGRAQVMQAEAAGIKPSVLMNPILLKPTSDRKSQVIVRGEVVANMEAREYFSYKKTLLPQIMEAFNKLARENDIIVIEGAGSPAEINLRENDIVNMGLAQMVDAPVLLVGDIDRGGVFAQLLGTLELLTSEERERVKGLIINKFRGDVSLLDSGILELEKRAGIPVSGVVPYMNIRLDDEDSLTSRFIKRPLLEGGINIGVVRLPHISNFSDFSVFEAFEDSGDEFWAGLRLHYLDQTDGEKLGQMDMVILPGSKNTIFDLKWLKDSGLSDEILDFADRGGVLFGICGGFQMLGKRVSDPDGVESGDSADRGSDQIEGLGLFELNTLLEKDKTRRQVSLLWENDLSGGFFSFLKGKNVCGYEIHMGRTERVSGGSVDSGSRSPVLEDFPGGFCLKNIAGSYIHGFFDNEDIAFCTLKALAERRNIKIPERVDLSSRSFDSFKEEQYDYLAETLRKHLDMKKIYQIMGIKAR